MPCAASAASMALTLPPSTAKSPVATARVPSTICTFTGLPYAIAGTTVRPCSVTAPETRTNPTCATFPRAVPACPSVRKTSAVSIVGGAAGCAAPGRGGAERERRRDRHIADPQRDGAPRQVVAVVTARRAQRRLEDARHGIPGCALGGRLGAGDRGAEGDQKDRGQKQGWRAHDGSISGWC